jgi:hypothetical protein
MEMRLRNVSLNAASLERDATTAEKAGMHFAALDRGAGAT